MTGSKLLGADWGVALAAPSTYMDVTKVSVAGPLVGVQQATNFNLGDVYFAPLVLGWHHGYFHYSGWMGCFAPTGEWHVGDLAPTGKNFWTFEPGLGVTYLNPKNGWEVSSYAALDFNSRNQTIDYKSGDDLHLDVTLAKHVLRPPAAARSQKGSGLSAGPAGTSVDDVALGIAFAWYQQLTADSGADNQVGSFKGRTLGLGPSFRTAVTLGGKPVTFQLRFLEEFGVQNRPTGTAAWFVTSLNL
jgi:hypothetical protein